MVFNIDSNLGDIGDIGDLDYTSPLYIAPGNMQGIHKPIKDHAVVQCLILRETEKAILVTVEDTRTDEWFPLSQVSYIYNTPIVMAEEGYEDEEFPDTIHVAKWLLDKKGIGY